MARCSRLPGRGSRPGSVSCSARSRSWRWSSRCSASLLSPGSSESGTMVRGALRAVGRALGWALVGMLLVGLALYGRYLRSGPELEPWHRARLDEEFTVARANEVRTIADYRALETRLFAELDREVYAATEPEDRLPYNRYYRGSRSDPSTWPLDWNR